MIEIEDVGRRAPALQNRLNAREIVAVFFDKREPRLRSVEVRSVRSERQARRVVVRLRTHSVEIESVHARAERPVALSLRNAGMLTPFIHIRRKGFRRDDRLAGHARAGDRLEDAEARVEAVALRPEFAHRNIRGAEEVEIARRIEVVDFRREF